MSKPMQIILSLVVLILVAAGSFYGGTVFGRQQANAATLSSAPGLPEFDMQADAAPFGDPAAGAGEGGQGGVGWRFAAQPGMLFGQIESIDGTTLVISDVNGQQRQVQVTDTTLIEKNASVTVANLEAGETVMVSGNENEDGSVTARSVQVAPAGRLGAPPSSQ